MKGPTEAEEAVTLHDGDELSECEDSNTTIRCPALHGKRLRELMYNIFFGQVLSLCLCGTAVSSQMLQNHGVDTPTTQSFMTYMLLALVFGTWTACRPGEANLIPVVRTRGWRYALLALVDVEANFLTVQAYRYTNLTSIQLLDCMAIPLVLLLSFLFLRVRYLLTHVAGVVLCLLGIGCVVWADILQGTGPRDPAGANRWLGDLLCLAGASLYAVSNVGEEALVKQFTRTEYLGMVGLIGSVISGIQLSIVDRTALEVVPWDKHSILLYYLLFAVCLFLFYSTVSFLIQRTSAAFFNLSVLTADFYTLLAGILIFKYQFHYLYFISFGCVIAGTIVYSLRQTTNREANSKHPGSPIVEELLVSNGSPPNLMDSSPDFTPAHSRAASQPPSSLPQRTVNVGWTSSVPHIPYATGLNASAVYFESYGDPQGASLERGARSLSTPAQSAYGVTGRPGANPAMSSSLPPGGAYSAAHVRHHREGCPGGQRQNGPNPSRSLERPVARGARAQDPRYRRTSVSGRMSLLPDLTWRGKEQVRMVKYCPKHGTIVIDDPNAV